MSYWIQGCGALVVKESLIYLALYIPSEERRAVNLTCTSDIIICGMESWEHTELRSNWVYIRNCPIFT